MHKVGSLKGISMAGANVLLIKWRMYSVGLLGNSSLFRFSELLYNLGRLNKCVY